MRTCCAIAGCVAAVSAAKSAAARKLLWNEILFTESVLYPLDSIRIQRVEQDDVEAAWPLRLA
jgi:hypothetical protein